MKNFAAKLGGKLWTIQFATPPEGDWGLCVYDDRLIYVEPEASEFRLLDTLIHESMHATLPFVEDSYINAASTEITRMLMDRGLLRLTGEQ